MGPAPGEDSYDEILYLQVQNVSSVAMGLSVRKGLIAAVMAWRHAGSLAFQ
jgi:hypothetical protein